MKLGQGFSAACLLLATAGVAASQELRLKPGTFKEIWTPTGKMIVIDGQEHPEAIPDYSAWAAVFRSMAQAQQSEGATMRVLKQKLKGMPEGDLQSLLKEGVARNQRYNDCFTELKDRQARMLDEGTPAHVLYKEGVKMIVGCRQELLDAADRLVAALSPDGQAILTDYLVYRRTTLTISYLADEVEDLYRRPR